MTAPSAVLASIRAHLNALRADRRPAKTPVKLSMRLGQVRDLFEIAELLGRVQEHEHFYNVLAALERDLEGPMPELLTPEKNVYRLEVLALVWELLSGMNWEEYLKNKKAAGPS